jgi:hypothetical protein
MPLYEQVYVVQGGGTNGNSRSAKWRRRHAGITSLVADDGRIVDGAADPQARGFGSEPRHQALLAV